MHGVRRIKGTSKWLDHVIKVVRFVASTLHLPFKGIIVLFNIRLLISIYNNQILSTISCVP